MKSLFITKTFSETSFNRHSRLQLQHYTARQAHIYCKNRELAEKGEKKGQVEVIAISEILTKEENNKIGAILEQILVNIANYRRILYRWAPVNGPEMDEHTSVELDRYSGNYIPTKMR